MSRMRTHKLITDGILALVVACVFLRCGTDPVSGNGSGTSSSSITGVALAPGGEPAAGASVYVFGVNEIPSPSMPKTRAIGPVRTDGKGRFDVAVGPNAGYNVTIESAGNKFFRDSIGVETEPVDLEECRLRPVGSLCGTVELSFGHDPRTVLILVYGSNVFTVPYHTWGAFKIDSLAPGDYTVRFMSTVPGYSPLDTVLTIRESSVDTLSHPVALEYTGLYTVPGLKVDWDPVVLAADLSWSALDSETVAGYNLYRGLYKTNHTYGNKENLEQTPPDFNLVAGMITDTAFTDTIYHPTDSLVIYQLRAVTVAGDEGSTSACTLAVGESYWNAVDTIALTDGFRYGVVGMDVRASRIYALLGGGANRMEVYDTGKGFVYMTAIDSPPAIHPDLVVKDSTVYIKSTVSVLKYDLEGNYAGAIPFGSFITDAYDSINSTFNVIGDDGFWLSTGRGMLHLDGTGSLVCEFNETGDIFKYRTRPIVQNNYVLWLSTSPNARTPRTLIVESDCRIVSEGEFPFSLYVNQRAVSRGCDAKKTFFISAYTPLAEIIHEVKVDGSLVSRFVRPEDGMLMSYDQSGKLYIAGRGRIITCERGVTSRE